MFNKIKADSIDLTEDDNASMMKRSPIAQRFKNMDGDESLSLTPTSIDGKW